MSNKAKVDKELYEKCIFNTKITLKSKGIFILMLLEPQKIYTEHDFITPIDKLDSVKTGLKGLLEYGYIEKNKNGYVVKELFKEKELPKNSGYVYVISDNYGNYKIGLTKNVAKRLDKIKVAMPYDIKIIKILNCNDMYDKEKELHKKFKNKRLNGEWFKLDEEDLKYISSLGGDF